MAHYVGSISLFDLDGASVLAYFDKVNLTLSNDTADTSSVASKGQRSSITKTSGTVTVDLRSVNGGGETVSHFDASALTLGAITFPCFKSTGIDISYETANINCVGSRFKSSDNLKLILKADIMVQAVDGTATPLFTPFDSAAPLSASNATYSLGFNGGTYTFPVLIQESSLITERGGLQDISVKLEGRSPDTGAFPTSPTGTTGLLQKALNAFNTPLAFGFQSKAGTGGVNVTGNLKFDSVSFKIEDEQIVPIAYNFRTDGNITVVAGS